MITQFRRLRQFQWVSIAAGLLAIFAAADRVAAQGLGYGVSANGTLFRFNLSDPDLSDAGSATTIGVLSNGVVPEGIDFRPTTTAGDPTRPLYAIDVGAVTTQLYIVNTTTAALTPVGAGFPSVVAGVGGYDLTGNKRFGFDFNPTTLQMSDGSIRIRLIADNGGANLRLNSDTGLVAVVDTPLVIQPSGNSPFADAAAYINSNKATIGGTTTLYDMDSRNDALYTQVPPNNGQLNLVGPFSAVPGTFDANSGIHFDVLSDANDADSSIAGDKAYAVLTRNSTAGGQYLFYTVNLATGDATAGVLVDGGRDFAGGLALTYVPEPATAVGGLAIGLVAAGAGRRRSRRGC